jgi:hypothetical protein
MHCRSRESLPAALRRFPGSRSRDVPSQAPPRHAPPAASAPRSPTRAGRPACAHAACRARSTRRPCAAFAEQWVRGRDDVRRSSASSSRRRPPHRLGAIATESMSPRPRHGRSAAAASPPVQELRAPAAPRPPSERPLGCDQRGRASVEPEGPAQRQRGAAVRRAAPLPRSRPLAVVPRQRDGAAPLPDPGPDRRGIRGHVTLGMRRGGHDPVTLERERS